METDELAQYLESLKREDCYRVDAVLKESPFETTQRVSFVGANGAESGPFIRKFIARDTGMGAVYERIFAAQQAGRRFKYVPSIVECYQRDDCLVVVMELVRGETLQDYVYRADPSVALAASVFPRLCDAVAELHEEFDPPIIHRDLKPSNIILSNDGLAIIDYGIAREYHEGADADTTQFGTRAFAPPEQFGFGQTTTRSDVYALGMLLYFCLTETIPSAAIRDAGFTDPRIPEALRQVIARATALDPAVRYASAAEMKAAFLQANANPAASNAAPSSVKPFFKSARNIVILVVLAFFLIVCVSAFVNPTPEIAQHSMAFNALAYLVFMPILFCGTALVLCDKTWLKSRFVRLRNWTFKNWLIFYAVVWLIVFLGIGFSGMAFPQNVSVV